MEISSRRISSILTLLLIPPKHLKSPLLCTPRIRDSLVHVEEKDADKDDCNECQYDNHGYHAENNEVISGFKEMVIIFEFLQTHSNLHG